MKSEIISQKSYIDFLSDVKSRIKEAQIKAAVTVNRELILLYREIGQGILEQQIKKGWGAKVIDHLSADLQKSFPEMKGFSPRNLLFMLAFAEAYPDRQIVKQLVAQIPWGCNIRIIQLVTEVSHVENIIKKRPN